MILIPLIPSQIILHADKKNYFGIVKQYLAFWHNTRAKIEPNWLNGDPYISSMAVAIQTHGNFIKYTSYSW